MVCGEFSESLEKKFVVHDVDGKLFAELLELWCAKQSIRANEIRHVILLAAVADRFQVTEVASMLERTVISELCVGSCAEVLVTSTQVGAVRTEEKARRLALERFEEVANTAWFLRMEEDTLGSLLGDDTLSVRSEETVLEILATWVRAGEIEGLGPRGCNLLSKVRFPLMEEEYLKSAAALTLLPPEHAGFLSCLLEEGLKAKAGCFTCSVSPATPADPLRPSALVPRIGGGVQWERYQSPANDMWLSGLGSGVAALTSCSGWVCGGLLHGEIHVWSRATRTLERTLRPAAADGGQPAQAVGVRALTAWGGQLVSGDEEGTLRVWDVATGRCVIEHKGHAAPVRALAALDGSLVSGAEDGTVLVWTAPATAGLAPLRALVGHKWGIRAFVAWNGMLISGSADCTVWTAPHHLTRNKVKAPRRLSHSPLNSCEHSLAATAD